MKKFFLSFLSVVLLSLSIYATPSYAQTDDQWLEYDLATETGTKEFRTLVLVSNLRQLFVETEIN